MENVAFVKPLRHLRLSGGCVPRTSKHGFTLLELLVVIMILSIMSTLVVTSLSGVGGSEDLNSSVNRLSKYVEYAQSSAMAQKKPVRVAIHYDPADSERFLRYVMLFYFDEDDATWRPLDEGQFLPAGIYFSPGLSTPGGSSPLKLWRADMDWDLFDVTNFTATIDIRSPFTVPDNTDQLRQSGVGKWIIYEYAPNGVMLNPGQRLVLVEGVLNASNLLRVPNEELADGFILFRAGRPAHFLAPEQIRGE